jgi:hypothetical protein
VNKLIIPAIIVAIGAASPGAWSQAPNLDAKTYYTTPLENDASRVVLESLQTSMNEAKIDVQIIPDQGILRLPETVPFKSGQPTIDASAVRTLKALTSALSFSRCIVFPRAAKANS